MAEDKIANLQRRLDEKLINPNDLNLDQKEALNVVNQSAELDGQRLNAAHERCVAVDRLVVRVGEFNSFGSLEQLGVDRA